jgi:hypothetical protein
LDKPSAAAQQTWGPAERLWPWPTRPRQFDMTRTCRSKTPKESPEQASAPLPPADNVDDGGASEFLEDDPGPLLPHLSFTGSPPDTTEQLAKLK